MTDSWDGEDRPARGSGKRQRGEAPNAIADCILASNRLVTDATGTVYRYEDGPWRELPDITLLSMAMAADGRRKSTSRRRTEIVSYLRAATHEPGLTWGRVGNHEIGCTNGILNVRNFTLRPHDPEHYLERVLPWNWDPNVDCPLWRDFLDDSFGDHEGGEAAALQEFFGYIAMSHACYKKALLLYGPTNTGKSVVEKVATMLVGAEACCTLSVEDMDDPRRRAVIKGKALNTMTELPAEAMIADSGFKTMVSTEDPVLLDQKYKVAERYVPTAKHLIACNTLPRLSDRTEATFGRLLIVPFKRMVEEGRQDPELPDKLRSELPGILVWAALGARRLDATQGRWSSVPAAAELLARYRDDINPVAAFVRECCVEMPGWGHSLRALNDAFNKMGYPGRRRTSTREFGQMARAAFGDHVVKDVKFVEPGTRRRRFTLKALVGWKLEAFDLPDGVEVPAVLATSDVPEVDAVSPPPPHDPLE